MTKSCYLHTACIFLICGGDIKLPVEMLISLVAKYAACCELLLGYILHCQIHRLDPALEEARRVPFLQNSLSTLGACNIT